MKHRKLLYFTLLLILPYTVFSQTPNGVNYQAVVRDPFGLPLNNQNVDVRFTIHQGSPTGTSVFQEVHTTSTNQFGLINLELGSIDTVAFPAINWGTGGAYYLQIEVDPGSGFDDLGASQLLSVPYALFAKSAATGAQGFNSLIDTVAAGPSCPNGGYQVRVGLDVNANMILDIGEITSSFFVCNGLNGSSNDTSATNEIQSLSISNDTIFLSNGGFVVLPNITGDSDWTVIGNNMTSGVIGNVGIGVLIPTKKLSIQSGALGGDGIQINNTTIGNPGIEFQTQGISHYVLGIDQSDNNKFKIGTSGVNVNTRFTINNAGQVGVGTINPLYQLMVTSPDSIVANFVGTSPSASAISVVGLNPSAKVGAVLLAGADTGYLVLDPLSKQLFLSNAMVGGHTLLYADSTTALYGLQVANIAQDLIYNQSNRIYNEADSIFDYSLSGTIVHANQGMFLTDSLYVMGNNKDSLNWILANDATGQAVWTNPSLLGGGSPWQPSGSDIYFNAGKVGIGTSNPLTNLHIAEEAQAMIAIQASHNLAADQAGTVTMVRSRGSIATPTNVISGDRLGKVEFNGWNSSTSQFEEVASIRVNADEAYTGGSTSSHMEFYVNPPGQNSMIEAVRINGNGNMGIGTSTPYNFLDVAGGSVIGSSYAGIVTAPVNSLLVEGNLGLGVSSSLAAKLDVNGNAKLAGGKLFLGPVGGVNNGYTGIYENSGDLVLAVFKPANITSFGNNSLDVVTIKSNTGLMGIGTATPSASLDIEGTFQLKDGTEGANKVLTSDASGNATWKGPIVFKGVFAPFGAVTIANTPQNIGGTANYSGSIVHNTAGAGFGGNQNIANMRFRAPETAYYHIHGALYVSISALQTITIQIYNLTTATILMNSVVRNPDALNQMFYTMDVSTLELLNQSDDVVLRVLGSAAGAGTIVSTSGSNTFEVSLIK